MKKCCFLLTLFFIFSCKNQSKKVEPTGPKSPYGNGVSIQTKNIQLKKAYLRFVDGKEVPQDNKVAIGQPVDMWLEIDGWKQEQGRSYLGVSEKIVSSGMEHVFEEPDMMATHPEGASAEDAKLINIRAVVNTMDKQYDYFLVTFRVWDKKGDGEISGSYKLHVQL
jgi:hypothetical protein